LTQPGGAFGQAALAAGSLAFELAKKWWVLALRGVILIIIGLLAFVNPLVWVTFVGVYMLFDGVSMLVAGIGGQPMVQSRWLLIIIGVLSVIAGLYILLNPVAGGLILTYVVAAWALVGGILTIITAIRLREEIDNEWWLIISGVLAVIFGLLVFFGGGPIGDDAAGMSNIGVVAGFLAIATVFGVFAILVGILSLVLAFRVRDFGKQIGAVS
jgi:uncharacterized membrane protein HdeD (DUF308 family)